MIRPVSSIRPTRPLDALRTSADQVRRAAEVLAEIAEDTAGIDLPASPPDPRAEDRAATIQKAQRSFVAGLHLAQEQEREGREG